MANKIVKFFTEIKIELQKVSWSTRNEVIGSTVVVLVSVSILALFIGVCDMILSRIVTIILTIF
ncbi:MAG: preprotein translocase subunit SecE [Candidatus Omnitrophota bacterium]